MIIPNYKGRFNYLKLDGKVAEETFGFDRYLNQLFYKSAEWRSLRNFVIARDNGNDMAFDGMPIRGHVYIHHMNPITVDDIRNRTEFLLDPEYLISVGYSTHNAIHYGDISQLPIQEFVTRKPNDTCPWK